MALADYYHRGALAAAQVLSGFDEERFRAKLDETPVGIAVEGADTPEARALIDLLVRLVARLYPRLALVGSESMVTDLKELAARVNPVIEFSDDALVGVSVGSMAHAFETTFHAGSEGWNALLSRTAVQPSGDSLNPFGAGAAACLAAANLFRYTFLPDWEAQADDDLRFSSWALDRSVGADAERPLDVALPADALLIGFGAIGNAALWALARAPISGTLHVVDPQDIELSNLQRYVLSLRDDEGKAKVDVAEAQPTHSMRVVPHHEDLAHFLVENGYEWDRVLLGLDSARDRLTVQASLPRWIANAWTQPGDFGVSVHPTFGCEGACVACLYLPEARLRNEDELVTEALRVPQLQMEIRTLLYNGAPLERPFLQVVAEANRRPLDALLPFEGRGVRELYVEGFCGGAVIPLSDVGRPPQDLHVPLAHQSAFAGVLLAAALARSLADGDPAITSVTRINVLRALGTDLTQPVRASRDGRCLCDDRTFRERYEGKYLPQRADRRCRGGRGAHLE